jgi:hypothetical protein
MFLGVFRDNPEAVRIASSLDKSRSWTPDLMIRGKGRYERDGLNVYGVAAFELG